MITCADVDVKRDLSPDLPIGSDSTENSQLELMVFCCHEGKHTRLSDTAEKHVFLEVDIGVVKR
jgi:hypothetical protein